MSRPLTQEAEAARQTLTEIAGILESEFERIRNGEGDDAVPDVRKLLLIYHLATNKEML